MRQWFFAIVVALFAEAIVNTVLGALLGRFLPFYYNCSISAGIFLGTGIGVMCLPEKKYFLGATIIACIFVFRGVALMTQGPLSPDIMDVQHQNQALLHILAGAFCVILAFNPLNGIGAGPED